MKELPYFVRHSFLQDYEALASKFRNIGEREGLCTSSSTDFEVFSNDKIPEMILAQSPFADTSVKLTFKTLLLLSHFKKCGKQIYYLLSDNCVPDNILAKQSWRQLVYHAPFTAFLTVLEGFEAVIFWENMGENEKAICWLKDYSRKDFKDGQSAILEFLEEGENETVGDILLGVEKNNGDKCIQKALKLYFQICFLNVNKKLVSASEEKSFLTGKFKTKRGKRIPEKKKVIVRAVEKFEVREFQKSAGSGEKGGKKSPHVRAGHLRRYKSGKTVFVREMSIRGGKKEELSAKIREVSLDAREKTK